MSLTVALHSSVAELDNQEQEKVLTITKIISYAQKQIIEKEDHFLRRRNNTKMYVILVSVT